jgi:hypothetical protein
VDITKLEFSGLIQNRKLSKISGPEFQNALKTVGWREGTGTHFLRSLRKDGPNRRIRTPAELVRAICKGKSEPGRNGTTIHRMCGGAAYVVYNATARVLVTFRQGSPPVHQPGGVSSNDAPPALDCDVCSKLVALALNHIAEIPKDVSSDGQLQYKLYGHGYVICIVGPNGVDDGGKGMDDAKNDESWDDIALTVPDLSIARETK